MQIICMLHYYVWYEFGLAEEKKLVHEGSGRATGRDWEAAATARAAMLRDTIYRAEVIENKRQESRAQEILYAVLLRYVVYVDYVPLAAITIAIHIISGINGNRKSSTAQQSTAIIVTTHQHSAIGG